MLLSGARKRWNLAGRCTCFVGSERSRPDTTSYLKNFDYSPDRVEQAWGDPDRGGLTEKTRNVDRLCKVAMYANRSYTQPPPNAVVALAFATSG